MKCADLPVINIKIKCLSFHAVFALTITIKTNARGYGVRGIILVSWNHGGGGELEGLGKLKRTVPWHVRLHFQNGEILDAKKRQGCNLRY